jgi:hypothetical protein
MKTCKRCGIEKDESEFHNQKNYKDGLDPKCKQCRKEVSEEYNQKNADRLREYRRNYYHREGVKKARREAYLKKQKKHEKTNIT